MSDPSPVTAGTPPPGWYADPMDGAGRRWWSGLDWTEYTELGPEMPEPDDTPLLRTAIRSASSEQAVADALAARSGRNDPYRDRELLSKAALVVALASIIGVGARLVVDVPMLLQLLVGGVPLSLAGLALFVAFRSSASMRLPLIAALISVATAAASTALDASMLTETMAGLSGLTSF